MSFIKNILRINDGLINQREWSKPFHNFILKSKKIRYNSTSYYFDRRNIQINKDHNKNVNELSSVAMSLNKQNLKLIKKYEESTNDYWKNDLKNRIEENESIIKSYSEELNKMLEKGFQLHGQGLIELLVLNQITNNKDVEKLYENVVLPQYLMKIQYLSIHNLTTLIEVMLHSQIQSTLIHKFILPAIHQLQNKQHLLFESVQFTETRIDQFRAVNQSSSPIPQLIQANMGTLCHFVNSFKLGYFIMKFQKNAYRYFSAQFLNRFTQREKRIQEELETDFDYDPQQNVFHLNLVLDELSSIYPQYSQQCVNIKAKFIKL